MRFAELFVLLLVEPRKRLLKTEEFGVILQIVSPFPSRLASLPFPAYSFRDI